MTVSCLDPYYTEYSCKADCKSFFSTSCNECCRKYYSHCVMFFGFLMSCFGIADLIVAGKIADECTYNGCIYSTLMLAQGVVSVIEGVMIFYVIGRGHEYSPFQSGNPTFRYAFATYSLTILIYFVSLILGSLQVKATNGVVDSGCTGADGYIIWRLVFIIIVPFSPIAVVLSALAIACACMVLAALGGAEKEENKDCWS